MKFVPLAAILTGFVASSAVAEVVIDQEYVGPSSAAYYFDYAGDYMAQTFTLRNTGQITSVGLQLSRPTAGVVDPLRFQLTRTNAAGEPLVTDVLASYDINSALVKQDFAGIPMVGIDLSNQNVRVQSGDVLALVLSSNYVHYDWNESLFSDQIAGGKFFVYSPKVFGDRWFYQWNTTNPTATADAGYRITIDSVPEATTALLATLATIASFAVRRVRS